jgi:type II secretory pathway predicted ATPase ExeA
MINHAATLALLECFGRGEDKVEEAVMAAVMLELGNEW